MSDPGSLTPLTLTPVAAPGAPGECVVNQPQGHPVFVVIKPSPVVHSKEQNLTSEEDLVEIMSLEEKHVVEVIEKRTHKSKLHVSSFHGFIWTFLLF